MPEKDRLPGQPFSSKQIKEIFATQGKGIDAELGNFILATIHLRRRRGTLVELGVRPYNKKTVWTEKAGSKALEWLRERHPMDENVAAAVFAENEARRLEEELNISKALKWGLIKPREDGKAQKAPNNLKLTQEDLYGKSMIQERREASEKFHAKELERMEKERKALREREMMRWKQKYVKRAEIEGKKVTDLVPSGDIKDVGTLVD